MTSIGQTIRYYRLMAGWSQTKLAEMAGISVISVRRYEEETGEQTIKTLRKIADALGVPVTELLDTSKTLAERSTIRVQKDKTREDVAPETQNWVYLDLPKLDSGRVYPSSKSLIEPDCPDTRSTSVFWQENPVYHSRQNRTGSAG